MCVGSETLRLWGVVGHDTVLHVMMRFPAVQASHRCVVCLLNQLMLSVYSTLVYLIYIHMYHIRIMHTVHTTRNVKLHSKTVL